MDLEEIKATLRLHDEKIDRSLRELELLKQISTDNLMAVLELRKGLEALSRDFRAFQDKMRAFKDEMLAFKDEMRAFKDEINRKWGGACQPSGHHYGRHIRSWYPLSGAKVGVSTEKKNAGCGVQKGRIIQPV